MSVEYVICRKLVEKADIGRLTPDDQRRVARGLEDGGCIVFEGGVYEAVAALCVKPEADAILAECERDHPDGKWLMVTTAAVQLQPQCGACQAAAYLGIGRCLEHGKPRT